MNTLIKQEFAEFIASKMEEREAVFIKNKRLEIKETNKFAVLFKQSKFVSHMIFELNKYKWNGKFYQYLRHKRKRTYKEMEDDKDDLLKEVNTLTKIKEDLEGFLKETCDELE